MQDCCLLFMINESNFVYEFVNKEAFCILFIAMPALLLSRLFVWFVKLKNTQTVLVIIFTYCHNPTYPNHSSLLHQE